MSDEPLDRTAESDGSPGTPIDVDALLAAVGEGIYGLDLDGTTTFVNPAAARMLGYEPSELLGTPQHEAIHHSQADGEPYPVELCPIYRVLRVGEPCHVEDEVFWRKDGTSFPVEYTATPIFRDGAMVGAVVTFRDIGARRASEEELRRREALMARAQKMASLGSWEWTPATDRVTWSPEFARIFDFPGKDRSGTLADLVAGIARAGADADRFRRRLLRSAESGESFSSTDHIRTRHGSVQVIESEVATERDAAGQVVTVTGVTRDTTAQRAAEAQERTLVTEQVARVQAEKGQREIRRILESISDAFFALDHEWRFTYVNEAGVELLGRRREELVGRDIWELYPDARGSTYEEMYRHAVASGEPVEFEEYFAPHGRWYAVRAYPSEGGLSVYFHDVTEAKEAREALARSEARYRFLLDAIPQQVWTARPDGGLDYVNEVVTGYFDRPAERIIGEGWKDVIHPAELEEVERAWTHSLETGEPYEVEFRLRRHDGAFRWHLGRARAQFGDSGPVKWFGTNTDIHDQKELEEAHTEAMGELARRNRDLDQFAYVASHDLKAPLRGLANLSTWIREDLGDDVPPNTAKHLDLMGSRVARLESLIDGLLQYSRAGRTAEDVEDVDTGELVDEATDLLEPPAGASVTREGEFPRVRSARAPLLQLFMNLIGNALKYGGGEAAEVVVRAEPVDGGRWRFSVADSGPGIPGEYHDRVWGLFQTLKPADRTGGSTGIGLAVVKKLVETHGGRVGLVSTPGEGSTFSFTWPTEPMG